MLAKLQEGPRILLDRSQLRSEAKYAAQRLIYFARIPPIPLYPMYPFIVIAEVDEALEISLYQLN